jgi:two-component system, sensor histidine kinase
VNLSVWLPPRATEVEYELFVLDYRNLLPHGVGQLGMSVVVVGLSWQVVQHHLLWVWLAWMWLSAAALFAALRLFGGHARSAVPEAGKMRMWRWAHPLLLTMVGIGWGGVGWLLVAQSPEHNLVIMLAFAGTLAYSAVTNAPSDPRGFGISAAIAIAMLAYHMPRAFSHTTPYIWGMSAVYLVVLLLAAHNARITLLESITLRLANEVLASNNAKQAALAEQANRDKSDFLAAASHDLRQPVHALLLLLEAYRLEEPQSAAHPLMHHITAAGQSINSLFNALMELSRLSSGAEKPVPSTFEVADLLSTVLGRIRPEAQRKGLGLRSWQASALALPMAHTDKVLLDRILGNLLSNAVRYTEQGAVLLSLRRAHHNAGLWVEVWDTGLGISADDRERIFEPYVQIGNLERDRAKGLGLGLSIVRQAVSLLGLQLSVLSHPGRGSCFRLLVPQAMLRPQPAPSPATPTAATEASTRLLAGRRILLVEDDPMALNAMQALLGLWRVDLRCASRGDGSVLDCCTADWIPECVLCDFRLPGPLNGIEVLDLVLEHYPQAVGILQTGELAQAVQAQAEEAGYLVLFKPVDAGVLASTLNALLVQNPKEAAR